MKNIKDKYPPIIGNAKLYKESIEERFIVSKSNLKELGLDKSFLGKELTRIPEPKNSQQAYDIIRLLYAQTWFENAVDNFMNTFKQKPVLINYKDQLEEIDEWINTAIAEVKTTQAFKPIKFYNDSNNQSSLCWKIELVRLINKYYDKSINVNLQSQDILINKVSSDYETNSEIFEKCKEKLDSPLSKVWGGYLIFQQWLIEVIEILEEAEDEFNELKPLFPNDPLCWFKTLISKSESYSKEATGAYLLILKEYNLGLENLYRIDFNNINSDFETIIQGAKHEITKHIHQPNLRSYIESELTRISSIIENDKKKVNKVTRKFKDSLSTYTRNSYTTKVSHIQTLYKLFFNIEEQKETKLTTTKIAAKYYALYHWITIDMGRANSFELKDNDKNPKEIIKAFAEQQYPGISAQGFYKAYIDINLTNKVAIAKSFGKGYKDKLIEISKNNAKFISHIKNYPE